MLRRTPKLSFIFITLLLDVLGFGLLIPVSPKLVERFLGLAEHGEEGKAAWAVGALAATYAFMQFFFAPILGSLSDRFGRRPVILISLFGSGIDYFAAAAAATWFPFLSLLFLTRVINGISGANISACNAYIADITPPEKRAAGYGLLGAAFGLGFMLGPLAGGWLGSIDLRLPFVAAGSLTLANWLYGLFVLPESLPLDKRRAFSWKKANPWGSLLWITRHPIVLALAASLFLLNVAQFGLHTTWVLSMSNRFAWTPSQVGWSLFVVGVSSVIVQGFLARKIIPFLGERVCLIAGILIAVGAFLGYAFATEGWMIYVIIAVASLGGVSGPALQAIVSKAVPPTEQGLLQGSLSSLSSIATICGALLGGAAFAYFTSDRAPIRFPGAPFVTSAFLSILALIPVLAIWQRMPRTVAQAPIETP